MTEKLRFLLIDDKMNLDVPQNVFDGTVERGEYFSRILGLPARQRVVTATAIDGGMRLVLNTKREGNYKDLRTKHDRCRQMVTALEEVASSTPSDQQDPNLTVEIGTRPIHDSDRYGFNATLRLPGSDYKMVESLASYMMRRTATDLRYIPKSILPSSVYAVIDRDSYVSLETNSMGSCSLDTDGMEYAHESQQLSYMLTTCTAMRCN